MSTHNRSREGNGYNIRRRMRHHSLSELINAFIGSGLMIEHVAELGERPVPTILAVRARKPPAAFEPHSGNAA